MLHLWAWRLVSVAAVLVVFASGQSGLGDQDGDDVICTTANCNATSAELLSSMNLSVLPCQDFYQYACGGWVRRHTLIDGQSSTDRYEKLREENDAFVKRLMRNPATRAEYRAVTAVQKLFKFYDSCMGMTAINNLGAGPINTLIQQYGSSKMLNPGWQEDDWDLQTDLAKMVKELGAKSLFEVKIELDSSNSSFYFISIKQPSKFSLPRHQLSGSGASERQARDKLQQFMQNITRALGANHPKLPAWIRQVVRFERKLEQIALPDNGIYSAAMTIWDFQKAVDPLTSDNSTQIFDWLSLFQAIFSDFSDRYTITSQTKIIVNGEEYFKRLTKYLKKKPKKVKKIVANYLMWKLVHELHLKLGQRFWDIHQQYQTAMGSTWQRSDRQDFCMEQLSSLRGFAMPLTRLFVDKKFKGGNKQWVLDATDRIRKVFTASLQQNVWMDDNTTQKAKKKAQSLMEMIGYPDYIMSNTKLNQMFGDVVIHQAKYFENVISLMKSWTKRTYAKAGQPKNANEWTMSPVEINAQYEDSYNRMVFPVAILQSPFYDGRYNGAVNFGGIGTVMGHELTHGFDDSGKKYDHSGNQVDWWSGITAAEFKRRADCLTKQYNSFTFNGFRLDGHRTLSENIADNGGLKQAYKAYQSWVEEFGDEPRLPGINLTNDQVFFVSFAQNWCATYDTAAGEDKSSNYSPTPIRVNGSLKNFAEFARVFSCPKDSPMNPTQQCHVW